MNKKSHKGQVSQRKEIYETSLSSASTEKIMFANITEKHKVNRCCLVHPKQKDFGQITENNLIDEVTDTAPADRYAALLSEQYGFNPAETNKVEAKQMRNVLSGNEVKGNRGISKFVETADGTVWQNIDNINDFEQIMQATKKGVQPPFQCGSLSENMHISDVPRVKVIAVKFSKYKREHIELRRLEEKIVCVEYDVYDRDAKDAVKRVQIMRAFFCIKPVHEDSDSEILTLPELPSNIKQEFNVDDDSFGKTTKKEIEIIDEKIQENKCYLDDLRRILKRKKITPKNKKTLDLNNLYEIAKQENHIFLGDLSSANLFSNSDLQHVKDLILRQCRSSIHGISRRKLLSSTDCKPGVGVLSGSIVAELLREDAKM